MTRRGLGKGLGALIPTAPSTGSVPQELPVDLVAPNPYQPRMAIDDAELEELTESIRTHGVLQPILVRPYDGGYQLVAGERRLRAARKLGLTSIPAVVKDCSDRQMLEFALIENLQRSSINPIEAATAYRRLVEEFTLTHDEVAERIGRSRAAVTNTLRLLELPKQVQDKLAAGHLTEGHGRALLQIRETAALISVTEKVLRRGLSVRQTEQLARKAQSAASHEQSPQPRPVDPILGEVENRLRRALGTQVKVMAAKKGGSILIEFYSEEDLERLTELLLSLVPSAQSFSADLELPQSHAQAPGVDEGSLEGVH